MQINSSNFSNNHNLFLSGKYFDNSTGHNKAYLVKTDFGGNLVWTKNLFGNPSYGNGSGAICKILNQGYLVSGVYNYYDVGPIHYRDCGLYRLDTNGSVLWYKKLFNNTNGGCFKVSEDSAGNFFLSGNLDTMITTVDYAHNGYIAKIDSNANIIWMHVFNEIPHILKNMWQYQVLPNGDLIFCGERLEALGTTVHVGWLCRMDSSGHIKWEHYYKQNDSSDYNCLTEVKQMPDGGFISIGVCRDSLTNPHAGAWVLRVDSNGCLIPGCVALNSIEVFPEEKMRMSMYPNPSDGNFVLEASKAFDADEILTMYDMTGKVIHTQAIPKGAYKALVSLRQATGLYLRTLTDHEGELLYKNKIVVY